ncbi:MAG: rRNA maturation RNAse YbeY, partial [Selenomonadaceae bacterium]|nr:rRNA maturation RNAse YbeY [Selenomonadaceae bacterium]
LLHLLGYDHVDDDQRQEMESEQRFIMAKLGIGR